MPVVHPTRPRINDRSHLPVRCTFDRRAGMYHVRAAARDKGLVHDADIFGLAAQLRDVCDNAVRSVRLPDSIDIVESLKAREPNTRIVRSSFWKTTSDRDGARA